MESEKDAQITQRLTFKQRSFVAGDAQLLFGQKNQLWIFGQTGQVKFVGFNPYLQRFPGGLQDDLQGIPYIGL